MNMQRLIVWLGLLLFVISSLGFYSVKSDYKKQFDITSAEIAGMNKVALINDVSILLKDFRGTSQFEDPLINPTRNKLSISPEVITLKLLELEQKELSEAFNQVVRQEILLSKSERFQKYTQFIELLDDLKLDVADNSYLLFELERDTYFLMSLTVLEMTKAIEQIGIIRGIGTLILSEESNQSEYLKNDFLLNNNYEALKAVITHSEKIINKLSPASQRVISPQFAPIKKDLNTLSTLLSSEMKGYSQEQYFLKVTESFSHVSSFFNGTKGLFLEKLENRQAGLKSKLYLTNIIYIIVSLTILLAVYLTYKKTRDEVNKQKLFEKRQKFMNRLQASLMESGSLKDICGIALTEVVKEFKGINASLYLWREKNSRLYLGATFGVDESKVAHQLKSHENLIGETLLSETVHISDVDGKAKMGTVSVPIKNLITLPLIFINKKVGAMQLSLSEKANPSQVEFLTEVVNTLSSHIHKAQQENEALDRIKQIDKNVLFSKTDIRGTIIDVSQEFCNLSQYSKEELIGQTHQIIRHPDMPKELFADLWKTIKQGLVWRGEIKNRAKDGSFYWVKSTISPDYDLYGNVIGYTSIRHDITDKKKVEVLSITDPLTGLFNRRYFDTLFIKQVAIAHRYKQVLNFALLDIDHFKRYNDTYGHQAGDETLKSVALTLKKELKRPDDYVFRLGGEEFGLLFFTENDEQAMHMAHLITRAIEGLHINHYENSASRYVTISTGLYSIESGDHSSVNEVYQQADKALYKAKSLGRNQIIKAEF